MAGGRWRPAAFGDAGRPSVTPWEDPTMARRFGYPLLGLFVIYLISLNATETGNRGNEFLSIVGGLMAATLDFLRGLAGDGAVTQVMAVAGL